MTEKGGRFKSRPEHCTFFFDVKKKLRQKETRFSLTVESPIFFPAALLPGFNEG